MTVLRRAALFLTAFMLMLIVFAPLQFALGRIDAARLGLSAAEVSGSIWSGRLEAASFKGLRLGDVHLALRPLPLLLGRSRLVLEIADGGPATGRAVLVREGGKSGVRNATLALPVELSQAALALAGELRLEGVTVVVQGDDCVEARGRITTDVLARNADLLQWRGPVLTGEIVCRGGSLLAPLRGAVDGTEVNAVVTLSRTNYRVQTRVATRDPSLSATLALIGFQPGAGGLTRSDAGRLR